MRAGKVSLKPIRVGEYVLERVLGVGGMAEVFVARRDGPHGFSKRVALKRILPQLASDPRLVAMFCDEARIQAELVHPNLVQVFDFGEHEGQPFMAMELVDGLSGAELITRVAARRSTVDLAVAIHIVRQVLEALSYVHSATDEYGRPLGVVHRDIAPSNILIGRSGQVKLGDFGIVRAHAIDARTIPGELKGKVGYVSPEQALGLPLDGRSDLFSLGIVLAELLICKPLFTGTTELEVLEGLHRGNLLMLDQHGAHVPGDLRAILSRALARWPEARFGSATEFAAALEAAAHAHRLTLGAHVLADWLADLGLTALSSDVREKPATSPPGIPVPPSLLSQAPPPRHSEPPFIEDVAIGREDSETLPPPASLADALSQLPASNDPPSAPPAAVSTARAVSYRLRETDGLIAGPFGLARVLGLVAVGRLAPDTEVSRNDGPFMPLGSVFELSRLSARPAYRFHEPVMLRARERWALGKELLPELAFELARGRRTGLFAVQREHEQIRVYFQDGTPTFTASTDPGELLGSRLMAAGAVGRRELEICLEQGWRRGLRLGDALVEAGMARAADITRLLVEQRQRRLVSLLMQRSGEVCFVDGAEHGEECGLGGRRFEIVAHALLQAYSDSEIASMLLRVEAGGTLVAGTELDPSELALPPPEAEALRSALRRRPFAALLRDARGSWYYDEVSLRRAVFIGLASGALRYTPGG